VKNMDSNEGDRVFPLLLRCKAVKSLANGQKSDLRASTTRVPSANGDGNISLLTGLESGPTRTSFLCGCECGGPLIFSERCIEWIKFRAQRTF